MQTQDQATETQSRLETAIERSQRHLLSLQHPEGYWWANLESNVTITAEVVLLHKIWGTDAEAPLAKMAAYLRAQQRQHGGWELFYNDGGELSTSVEAYMALRLLGVPASAPEMQRAKAFILSKGGISKTRIFTKFHLALIGCYDWRGIPSIPPAVMLLPDGFPVNIYEMSSWARGSTVPLLIVFDRRPVYVLDPAITLDELYVEAGPARSAELPRSGDWSDLFVELDSLFKLAADWNVTPWREAGIQAAERWIIERQEESGDWGGIIPAMLNSMLALRTLNYRVADPVIVRGMAAIERFGVETAAEYWVQPCVSPVWDTALVMRSLVDSGLPADHSALTRGADWLLQKQIFSYGDWAVKNRAAKPGGWAFEFENRFYPDVDDTAVVVMALQPVPSRQPKQIALERALQWTASMQCSEGGWAAFDLNNNQDWLNAIPYGDLKAMIDPNTADVTARVLEMVARLDSGPLDSGPLDSGPLDSGPLDSGQLAANSPFSRAAIDRALAYLRQQQEPEGCWFGRWGVNYIYGTSGVLVALSLLVPQTYRDCIERGANWLASCQNPDGGWGETCQSYVDPALKGKGPSTPSQTAWALIGLLAAGGFEAATQRGVDYLLSRQNPDGTWDEAEFTGTGFPGHFYLNYNLYRQHFPLTALGRYRAAFGA